MFISGVERGRRAGRGRRVLRGPAGGLGLPAQLRRRLLDQAGRRARPGTPSTSPFGAAWTDDASRSPPSRPPGRDGPPTAPRRTRRSCATSAATRPRWRRSPSTPTARPCRSRTARCTCSPAKVAQDAAAVEQADVDALRAVGLTDADVADVVFAAAARCFFTAVLDGLGTQLDEQTAQHLRARPAGVDGRRPAGWPVSPANGGSAG